MSDWSASQYLKFEEERTRPAKELLDRVLTAEPKSVVDLGCGPGNSTILLKEKWPQASILGIDNSDDMLKKARQTYHDISFAKDDAASWTSSSPVDLIFANAIFQWLDKHELLFPHLVNQLTPGGTLALQMPHNHQEPSHRCMREVAARPEWKDKITGIAQNRSIHEAQTYYDILSPCARQIDIWQTEYFHIMDSISGIVEWVKGTGLRPFLAPLADAEQMRFIEQYEEALACHYKTQADGRVVFPFRRLFIVCQRS